MSTIQTTNIKHNASASNNITLDSAGNVGVGTATPAVTLEVNGNIRARAASGEGGELQLNNPDNATVGAALDVSTADLTRWFTIRNNSQHQIGQLIGTGGIVTFHTAGVERMRLDSSGNLQFNSGYGSVGTAFGCRAWVNFNGTGTVAIRASGNVSSITDNGTGDYTVNFTAAMSDANYSISVVHSAGSGGTVGTNININGSGGSVAPTTSAFRMVTVGGGSVVDPLYVNASVIR